MQVPKAVLLSGVVLIILVVAGIAVYVISMGGRVSLLPTSTAPTASPATSPTAVTTPTATPLAGQTETTPPVATPPTTPIRGVILSETQSGAMVGQLAHRSTFAANTPLIKVTVQLDPQVAGDKTYLKVVYQADQSTLGPASAAIKSENGQKYATFEMSRPANGWPTGNYTAIVALDNGASQEVRFTIN